jgi:hypothetical protein
MLQLMLGKEVLCDFESVDVEGGECTFVIPSTVDVSPEVFGYALADDLGNIRTLNVMRVQRHAPGQHLITGMLGPIRKR